MNNEDVLDKALRIYQPKESDITEYLWAIPADVFCDTFEITSPEKVICRHCLKECYPLLPFYFKTEEGETVVGVFYDHLDCTNINGSSYNPLTMCHIDEDSEFNKSVKELFKAFEKQSNKSGRSYDC